MSEPEPTTSDTAFWNDVEEVFSSALDVRDDQRRAFLDARCAGRAAVRAEVESLLGVHDRAGQFMRHPTMPSEPADSATPREGDIVGQFKLVELVAAGGMGIVYRAERADGAFEQSVAVKIISAPIAREDVRRRFLAERQILASLHHPHIVGLLDAGLTTGGHAYLIMEFVDGVPITTYCRDRVLSADDRLRLVRQVCDAVQYAHAHFVVHSDLKPANVLVTSDGIPKVLDFGIATLLEGPLALVNTLPAGRRAEPLTPNYASPEQLRGADITVASDVFGLGMLMFELLTGARPYDVSGKPLDEALRIVAETPTLRPSEARPGSGGCPPYDLRRTLRGDLDAIAVRACHRAPEQRYASADALSQDLARYLNGAPVDARKPTFLYIARKLAGRHRVAVASAALSALLVVAALGVAVWQAEVATLEHRRADRRFNDVRQLANAVIFEIHDAVAPLPGSTPVRQSIVTEGLKYLERLSADAEGDPQLNKELGRAYLKIGAVQGRPNTPNLGDREGAVASFRRAKTLLGPLATRATAQPDEFRSYLDSIRFLSETLGTMGESRHEEATAEAREAMAAAERFAAAHPALDEARSFVAAAAFALAMRVERSEALPYWQKAAAEYDALLAATPDDPVRQRNAALVDKYLGELIEDTDLASAAAHYQRALMLDQKRFDREPESRMVQFDLAVDLSLLANVHHLRGELAEAIAGYTRCLDIRERLALSDPQDSLASEKAAFIHLQLGLVHRDKRETILAVKHFRSAIAGFGQAMSVFARREMAASWAGLAAMEAASGRNAESCDAFRRSFSIYRSLTDAERRAATGDRSDPLPAAGRSAATCGDTKALQWEAGRITAHTPPH